MIRSNTIIMHFFFFLESWLGDVGRGREWEREILQVDVLNESELWMIFITESPLKIDFPPLTVSWWQARSISSFYTCLCILYHDSMRFTMPFAVSKHFYLPPNCLLIFHCFIYHSPADIMSFCTSWLLIPRTMVLYGKSNFFSVLLLSAIRRRNCWPVQINGRKEGLCSVKTHTAEYAPTVLRNKLLFGREFVQWCTKDACQIIYNTKCCISSASDELWGYASCLPPPPPKLGKYRLDIHMYANILGSPSETVAW